MIPGIAPAISKKKAAPDPGGGYSFTMTAGNFANVVYGYSNGGILPAFGSINAEPVPDETLESIMYSPTGAGLGFIGATIVFAGDIVDKLQSKILYVDGDPYTPSVDWFYDSNNDITRATWENDSPEFVEDEEYFIEFK